ncbi:MAG: inorganic diphosphatase [Gammaproteobacteria bacterium]|nr:MAG: inorganic diphosphatase [Gammaproteobacteria bacterium]UTW43687.1 inorganic diphosphatase [bacterium SCSIO 12844]
MISSIQPGKNIPDDINVIIEIPAFNEPVKYEFDKEANILVVDRFMTATMQYPCNYGFIPNTLSDDGDPADVLVYTPVPLRPGTMIRCRPVGVLKMTDESGVDAKIIAVPVEKLWKSYAHIKDIDDMPETLLNQIKHFFEHYKDLEPGKWVKVDGFDNAKAAKDEIIQAVDNFEK